MPRKARQPSRTGIYHIMMRGVNRQRIFHDDQDRAFFLSAIKKSKAADQFRLHAFCLMPNHVHLLLEQAEEPLETVFKRIGVSYANWYNRKYERVGHLFQDRFRSENVETEQYYMTVLRYILQNPVKAGMVSEPGMYRWSSYLAYENGTGAITDTQYAVDVFGSREQLIGFVREKSEDSAMDESAFDRKLRYDLEQETMRRITHCQSASEFQKLDRSTQKEYVLELHQANLTGGQISVFTGMPKTTVYRLLRTSAPAAVSEEQEFTLREPDTFEFIFDDGIIW